MSSTRPWENRLHWGLQALRWFTLTLGVFVSFLERGPSPGALAAAGAAGVYVVGSQVLPRRFLDRTWVGEIRRPRCRPGWPTPPAGRASSAG